MEGLTSNTGIDFKNGDGPGDVHDLLISLSELLSQREPNQPPTKSLTDILTRLAMMSAFGLAIRSIHKEVGED